MDAAPASRWSPVSQREGVRNAVRWSVAALVAVGAMLAARRAANAFTAELPTLHAVVTAVALAAIVFGGRWAWRRAGVDGRRIEDDVVGWGGTAAIVLIAVGCWSPTGDHQHWLVWAPLWIADQVSRHRFLRQATGTPRQPAAPARASADELPPTIDSDLANDVAVAGSAADEPVGVVVQQLTRVRDAAGAESIHGVVRADFQPHQRHAVVHVGFCPPLASLPDVEAECGAGPDATVKVTQAFAHGARLEVHLDQPAATNCHVLLELAAQPAP